MTALPGKPAANAEQNTDSNVEPLVRASPGARLRKTREYLNLGVAEAAQSLNLSPGVIRALEADDYRTLPNATFVKGYIRSYARVLGIASEELVRGYEAITGCDKPKPVVPIEMPRTGPNGAPLLFSVIALIVAIAMIAFFVLTDDSPKQVVNPESEQVSLESTRPASASALEQGSQTAGEAVSPDVSITTITAGGSAVEAEQSEADTWIEEQSPVTEDASSQIADSPPTDHTGDQPTASAESASPQPHVTPFSEVTADTPAPSDRQISTEAKPDVAIGEISMIFTGDCWVEVRDGSGELIYSNLKRLGETLTLQGQAPLEAKLGNGNVVSLSYNGNPVSFRIPPHNVVRVRLGE